jgi:hypothetical protein
MTARRHLAWPRASTGGAPQVRLLQPDPAAPRPGPPHPGRGLCRPAQGQPVGPLIEGHVRVRHDKIDTNGTLTLRHNSRLHHIGLGRRYAGTPVLVLVHDLHIRVLSTSGRLLRDLTLDPTRDYQPQART